MKVRDKTKLMKEIEEATGKDIRELLNYLYRDKNMTFQEIEGYMKKDLDININYSTIHYWFMKFGMKSREYKL